MQCCLDGSDRIAPSISGVRVPAERVRPRTAQMLGRSWLFFERELVRRLRLFGHPPEQAARFMLTMFRATREGYFAEQDPLLAELLGREPRGVAAQLAEQIAV